MRLERHGVPASAFCLDVTERAVLDDLQRLPVEGLKIDKFLVLGMQTDANNATTVRLTIDLAHNLGLSVATEGDENAAVLAPLRALACDEAQGYPIKPAPASRFLWVLAHASSLRSAPRCPWAPVY